jgi:hypothetical protein
MTSMSCRYCYLNLKTDSRELLSVIVPEPELSVTLLHPIKFSLFLFLGTLGSAILWPITIRHSIGKNGRIEGSILCDCGRGFMFILVFHIDIDLKLT